MKSLSIKRRKYKLEPLLTDSFAELFIATIEGQNVPAYMVKFLGEKLQSNALAVKRFEEEHTILKMLQTHNHCFPSDVNKGLIEQQLFIAYQFIDGETLIHYLKNWNRKQFTVTFCCELIRQLLNAIGIMHHQDQTIVHSDISPENVLLKNNQLFLIDFGCAQRLKEGETARQWKAKPGYLSPEQARGESWDQRSDIYQAGILFYEILTGRKWNTGSTAKERVAWASAPPPLNVAAVPLKLRPLLRGLLEPDPSARIQSVDLCLMRLVFALRAMEGDEKT